MGPTGDSYDNALMENFWSTLKIELVYRNSWRTRDEAENALFTYIDGRYDTRRIQARLGDRSPDQYEAAWYAANIEQPDPSGTALEPTESSSVLWQGARTTSGAAGIKTFGS